MLHCNNCHHNSSIPAITTVPGSVLQYGAVWWISRLVVCRVLCSCWKPGEGSSYVCCWLLLHCSWWRWTYLQFSRWQVSIRSCSVCHQHLCPTSWWGILCGFLPVLHISVSIVHVSVCSSWLALYIYWSILLCLAVSLSPSVGMLLFVLQLCSCVTYMQYMVKWKCLCIAWEHWFVLCLRHSTHHTPGYWLSGTECTQCLSVASHCCSCSSSIRPTTTRSCPASSCFGWQCRPQQDWGNSPYCLCRQSQHTGEVLIFLSCLPCQASFFPLWSTLPLLALIHNPATTHIHIHAHIFFGALSQGHHSSLFVCIFLLYGIHFES